MKLLRTLLIGRSADCDIRLDHDTVSRRHARLELLSGARLALTDLGSSNGTHVEEGEAWSRIDYREVTADQPLRFGEFEVQLRALLEAFPAFAIVLNEEALSGEGLEFTAGHATPRHERPRRNPSTGDIEEDD